eukprot:Tbor_TRINITY_DN106_c0_g1::TRINITY_DN106_c0_g1_i1::g.11992::m.11992
MSDDGLRPSLTSSPISSSFNTYSSIPFFEKNPLGALVPHSPSLSQFPSVKRIRIIESIARHRELHGCEAIHELQDILKRAISSPNPCLTLIPGPDTLCISQNPDLAVEFLIDIGFEKRESTSIKSLSSSSHGFSTIGSPLHNHASRMKSNETNTPITNDNPTRSAAPLELFIPIIPDKDSLDWVLFKKEVLDAHTQLSWALSCNTSQLTVKLHGLMMFGKPIRAEYRAEVELTWDDGGGQRKWQTVTSLDYHPADASVTIEYNTAQCSNDCDSNWRGDTRGISSEGVVVEDLPRLKANQKKSARSSPSIVSEYVPKAAKPSRHRQHANYYHNFMAIYLTSCDRPCSVDVRIVTNKRKRSSGVFAGGEICSTANTISACGIITEPFPDYCTHPNPHDTVIAIGNYPMFDNRSSIMFELDLKSAECPMGLPIGRINLVIDSIQLRFQELEQQFRRVNTVLGSLRHTSPLSYEKGDMEVLSSPESAPQHPKEEEPRNNSTNYTNNNKWIEPDEIRKAKLNATTAIQGCSSCDAEDYY